MVDKKICCFCKKEILYEDKQVSLETKKGNMIMEKKDFHYECWLNDYAESVDRKVKAYADKLMSFAKPAVEKALESRGMLG